MKGEIHRTRGLKHKFEQLLTELAEQDAMVDGLRAEHGTATHDHRDLHPLAELFDANNGIATERRRTRPSQPNPPHVFVRC